VKGGRQGCLPDSLNYPLLPVAAALAAGVFAAARWEYFLLNNRECLLAATIMAAVAAVALLLRRDRLAVVAALLGFFLTGATYLRHEREFRSPHSLETLVAAAESNPSQADLDEPMHLTGWVSLPPEPRELAEAFELTLETVESRQKSLPAEGKVRLYHYIRGDEKPLGLLYGERLTALVRLRRVRGFWNPGDYDREARGQREGVMFQGTVKTSELVERLSGRGGSRATAWLLDTRHKLLAQLDRLYPPEGPPDPTNAILRAMLLGDRSGLDRRTTEDFEKTGTFHALVIAGLHTAAFGGFLLLALRLLRVPMWAATPLAIGGVAGFAVISGLRVPVERAALMFALYLVARFLFRQRALLNAAAAAALVLLVLQPDDLTDAGFQMSFLAVLLIGALSQPAIEMTSAPFRRALTAIDNSDLDDSFTRWPRRLRTWLRDRHVYVSKVVRVFLRVYELAVTGAVIQLGFTLPMAAYFFRGGNVAIPANLLMVPLIGMVVPLGALTLLVSLIWPPLAALPAVPLGWGVAMMTAVARWHAGYSLAVRRVPPPPLWLDLAFLGALLLLAACLAAQRAIPAALSAVVVLAAAALIVAHPFRPELPRDRLEVTTLDVGQGDSIFVVAPTGRTLLVDGGGLKDADYGTDTGADAIAPYLWTRGIRRLDVVALTHAHQDHIGGLFAILRDFDVGELWIGPNPESEVLKQLKILAQFRGIPVVEHHRGELTAWGGAKLEFLSPAEDYHPASRPGNNDSLVMRISLNKQSVLLAGDVERKMENELVNADVPLAATLLKVPHHGSKTSSNEPFLGHVHAAYGVISVAVHSPFGHPNEDALARLSAAGVHILRTDHDGAVTWSTDGSRVVLHTFAENRRVGIAWGW
jgi:competence protein ComEC